MPSKAFVISGLDFSVNKLTTVTFATSIPCTGISLDTNTKSCTSLSNFTLTATPVPANTTDTVTWSTSDSSVATVSSGVVTPLKLGETTITVTCGNYSATCSVTIDDVKVPYKVVAGYEPFRRTSSGTALTVGQKTTGSTGKMFIIANDQQTGLYQIESKNDVDTSPYRFVPILIPVGAATVTITTTLGNIKTRSLYIDSTKQQTTFDTGVGAFCVYGSVDTYDQGSVAATPITLSIPENITGLDSCCFCMVVNQNYTYGTDYTEYVDVVFSRASNNEK